MDLYQTYVSERLMVNDDAKEGEVPFKMKIMNKKIKGNVKMTVNSDHLFYFQYVHLRDGEIEYPSKTETDKKYFSKLGKYEKRFLGHNKNIKSRIKYVYKANSILRSLPLKADVETLQVTVPYRNPECYYLKDRLK